MTWRQAEALGQTHETRNTQLANAGHGHAQLCHVICGEPCGGDRRGRRAQRDARKMARKWPNNTHRRKSKGATKWRTIGGAAIGKALTRRVDCAAQMPKRESKMQNRQTEVRAQRKLKMQNAKSQTPNAKCETREAKIEIRQIKSARTETEIARSRRRVLSSDSDGDDEGNGSKQQQ